MNNAFRDVALRVVKRFATENPGHHSIGVSDLEPELTTAFPELDHQSRPVYGSRVLEEIDALCVETTIPPVYSATTGERLCIMVSPKIWPFTIAETRT